MGASFWIKRFTIALLGSSILLFCVELAKGHDRSAAVQFAIFWGLAFAALFTGIGYFRFKRNPACMLPKNREE